MSSEANEKTEAKNKKNKENFLQDRIKEYRPAPLSSPAEPSETKSSAKSLKRGLGCLICKPTAPFASINYCTDFNIRYPINIIL
jgi:hypothetical protein